MTVLEVQTQKKDFKQVPAGTHVARIIRIIDLGIQTTPFKDKDGNLKKPRQLIICFEIASQKTDDGKPMTIYTKSLNYSLGYTDYKTKLREYAEAILGEEVLAIDLAKLLNKPAMISIAHVPGKDASKKYAQITGVMKVIDGIVVPEASYPLLHFSTTEFDKEVYDQLEEWLQKKIALPAGINLAANDDNQDASKLLA